MGSIQETLSRGPMPCLGDRNSLCQGPVTPPRGLLQMNHTEKTVKN